VPVWRRVSGLQNQGEALALVMEGRLRLPIYLTDNRVRLTHGDAAFAKPNEKRHSSCSPAFKRITKIGPNRAQ
jgi:hypothetical protein